MKLDFSSSYCKSILALVSATCENKGVGRLQEWQKSFLYQSVGRSYPEHCDERVKLYPDSEQKVQALISKVCLGQELGRNIICHPRIR